MIIYCTMYARRTLYLSNIIRAISITTRMMLKKTEMTIIPPKMARVLLLSAGSLVSPCVVVTNGGISGDKAAVAGPRTGGHVVVICQEQ